LGSLASRCDSSGTNHTNRGRHAVHTAQHQGQGTGEEVSLGQVTKNLMAKTTIKPSSLFSSSFLPLEKLLRGREDKISYQVVLSNFPRRHAIPAISLLFRLSVGALITRALATSASAPLYDYNITLRALSSPLLYFTHTTIGVPHNGFLH
jgi:hypothetical protein